MTQPNQSASSLRFMVALSFESGHEAEIAALIPQEQAHIRGLIQRGAVETIYISADRSLIWLIMRGASRQEVEQALTYLPLYPYMRPVVTRLANLAL
ncbi:MAG TPA: muconolactone Delta-isomerase family protein [Ktedonobacterales bacterium]|jgi:muconolactone delta-isomerase|nr:muconolactone Delta-isomerase family protein [Ktedonobacterales bacterium]